MRRADDVLASVLGALTAGEAIGQALPKLDDRQGAGAIIRGFWPNLPIMSSYEKVSLLEECRERLEFRRRCAPAVRIAAREEFAVMTTTFFLLFLGIFAVATAMGVVLGWAARSEKYGAYRIHKGRNPIAERLKLPTIAMNYALPWIIYGGFFYFLGNRTIYAGVPTFPRLIVESLGSIILYDFLYYFLHRAMHTRAGMRIIHGVHHKVRYVTAESGSYLHPLETFAGTALFLAAVVIVGPVSGAGFLIANFLFTTINIWVHSNFVFSGRWAGLLNFWTRTHDVHHYYCRNNYSSIFPFWDQMFGTHEAGVKLSSARTATGG